MYTLNNTKIKPNWRTDVVKKEGHFTQFKVLVAGEDVECRILRETGTYKASSRTIITLLNGEPSSKAFEVYDSHF